MCCSRVTFSNESACWWNYLRRRILLSDIDWAKWLEWHLTAGPGLGQVPSVFLGSGDGRGVQRSTCAKGPYLIQNREIWNGPYTHLTYWIVIYCSILSRINEGLPLGVFAHWRTNFTTLSPRKACHLNESRSPRISLVTSMSPWNSKGASLGCIIWS